jgi:hypothetical protein
MSLPLSRSHQGRYQFSPKLDRPTRGDVKVRRINRGTTIINDSPTSIFQQAPHSSPRRPTDRLRR